MIIEKFRVLHLREHTILYTQSTGRSDEISYQYVIVLYLVLQFHWFSVGNSSLAISMMQFENSNRIKSFIGFRVHNSQIKFQIFRVMLVHDQHISEQLAVNH